MVIGPDFVYLAVPRTGSNLMLRVFLPRYGGEYVEPHHGRVVPEEHRHKFTFAVVRNPYDRWLSVYHHLILAKAEVVSDSPSSEEFMTRIVNDPIHRGMYGWEGALNQVEFLSVSRIDRVLRYENLAEEIKTLPFVRPDDELPEERVNAAPRPHWTEEATPEFIAMVNLVSAPVFEKYGYEMVKP